LFCVLGFLLLDLLWDDEHRFPKTVGPKELRPTKSGEIHAINLLAERREMFEKWAVYCLVLPRVFKANQARPCSV
jgi:hypothetical protein